MDSDPPSAPDIPPPIQSLVDQYPELFSEPVGIPPSISHTYSIPLVPGAQPFWLKPYRYTPFQKDEIECQVTHLLKTNMIKESTSPLASPALLMKKKIGDWKLCVDYRRLNAYKVKISFHFLLLRSFLKNYKVPNGLPPWILNLGFTKLWFMKMTNIRLPSKLIMVTLNTKSCPMDLLVLLLHSSMS